MAIRTIDAPGIEIHEIDKSQYSPAMTGTKVLVTGFANSGEDYIPMIFTSKSAWLNYYGEPDNEAERYFYAASMEVLNQNGVVNCCKLPYENEARDKFVGFKYKLNTVKPLPLSTVSEVLNSEKYQELKNALPNSEVFNRDVLNYFLQNCNVKEASDKLSILQEIQLPSTSLSILDQYVTLSERSDGKTSADVIGKDFYEIYASDNEKLSSRYDLISSFIETISKGQLVNYMNDLSAQSTGVIPRLNAYYFINTTSVEITDTSEISCHQDISVVMECDAIGHYSILTAVNDFVSADVSSCFLVDEIYDIVDSDPSDPQSSALTSQFKDEIFALFESNREDTLTPQYFDNNGLCVRFSNGIDAFQLVVDGSNSTDSQDEQYRFMVELVKNHNFILKRGENLDDAVDYFNEIAQNGEALQEAKIATIKKDLEWSEIKSADSTIDQAWEIAASGSPCLYEMATIDEYRTDESRVGTNQILVVDKTRKTYGKVPEDKFHKNDGRELIGIIPIITTAANALYAQSMIDVDDANVTDYETIHDVKTLDSSTQPYTFLGNSYDTHTTMAEGELSTVAVISQRFNNKHTEEDNDDDFFDSLALQANSYFPSISLQGDGSFDRENMKKIGLVVVKAFLDASEGNRVSFQIVESFVGSLDRDAKNPNTGATTFIDTLVNEQSEYVDIFTNCFPTNALKETYNKYIDILVMPHETADVASMGFYEGQCEEEIDISESILKALDMVYDKVTDINERDIDIVVDGGISNIAQFIKSVYGKKGFYDPASPDAALWKCKKDNDVKMWKTVIMKYDNFCKNIRKDCMFIADGPRPYCLQGQKKIVRPSKPKNTIDAEILPYTKYLTGINTSYGAGYCDWFQVADEFTGDYFWCPPSIKACGIYIYTDLNFEYWDAPAGLNRGIVAALDVAFSPTNKQAGQIYTKNWNYAINYPQDGIVLEGQKTLQAKPSALDRVNVRRLLLRLERATYRVLRYVVYEGNTAYMRQRVVDLLDPYFKEAKIGGGLYDYKIICDESNNTPETIDRNELHISIGVKPVKTIEFIICNFVILPTGASWDEM